MQDFAAEQFTLAYVTPHFGAERELISQESKGIGSDLDVSRSCFEQSMSAGLVLRTRLGRIEWRQSTPSGAILSDELRFAKRWVPYPLTLDTHTIVGAFGSEEVSGATTDQYENRFQELLQETRGDDPKLDQPLCRFGCWPGIVAEKLLDRNHLPLPKSRTTAA